MAKGQKRSTRELKKPKAAKKPAAPDTTSRFSSPVKANTPKPKAGG